MTSSQSGIRQTMGAAEWSLLLTLSFLWGITYFFVGVAVNVYAPLFVVLARVGIAAVALVLLLLILRIPLPASSELWRSLFIMAILNNLIPFSLVTWGQTHIGSGLAAILNASTPLFAMIVAHFYSDDEKLTKNRTIGLVIGFVGVITMIGMTAVEVGGSETAAQLAVIGGAFSFALASVFGRRFQRLGVNPMVTATGQLIASTIIIFPVALFFAHPWVVGTSSIGSVGALVGLALLSTAAAYIVYFRLLSSAGAVNLLLVTLLLPVTAIILGVVFLDEVLLPKHLVGMGLIALGLGVMDGRPIRYLLKILSSTTKHSAID